MVLEEVASGTVGMGKTAVDEFMLSEYQTIAAAHFDLHGGLRQNFRFYLGLIAVPFTVLAVYKDATLQVYHLPTILLLLLAIVPVLGFLMFLAMVNMRLTSSYTHELVTLSEATSRCVLLIPTLAISPITLSCQQTSSFLPISRG